MAKKIFKKEVKEHDSYKLVAKKLQRYSNGDTTVVSWLNGFKLVNPNSPLSLFIKQEMDKIKEERWGKN